WGDEHTEKRVVLVGDSNGRQWLPVFQKLIPEFDTTFIATTFPACPFVDMTLLRDGNPYGNCRKWVDQTIRDLEVIRPNILFVGSAMDGYVRGGRYQFLDDEGDVYSSI